MKICIPVVTNDGYKSELSGHFGSAQFFMIYDTDSDTFETLANTNMHHSHGMCQPLSILGNKHIEAVVCQGMGMGAFQKLKSSGTKAYRTNVKTVEQLIKEFKDNILEEITIENTCAGHNCH